MSKNRIVDDPQRPAWQTKESCLMKLEAESLARAQADIERATNFYNEFLQTLASFRAAIEWMYAMYDGEVAMPFDEACSHLDCNPDTMRELMLKRVPEGLTRIAFRGNNFSCPFIAGRKCSGHTSQRMEPCNTSSS